MMFEHLKAQQIVLRNRKPLRGLSPRFPKLGFYCKGDPGDPPLQRIDTEQAA
jgi:hypothetical protein